MFSTSRIGDAFLEFYLFSFRDCLWCSKELSRDLICICNGRRIGELIVILLLLFLARFILQRLYSSLSASTFASKYPRGGARLSPFIFLYSLY